MQRPALVSKDGRLLLRGTVIEPPKKSSARQRVRSLGTTHNGHTEERQQWRDKTKDTVTQVIGFDFGHAETAVTKANMDATTQPAVLKVQGQAPMVTAVAETKGTGAGWRGCLQRQESGRFERRVQEPIIERPRDPASYKTLRTTNCRDVDRGKKNRRRRGESVRGRLSFRLERSSASRL